MRSSTTFITIAFIAMQALGIAATQVTILKKGERITWVEVPKGESREFNIRGKSVTVSVSDDGTPSISGSKYTVE